jgi:dTDP-4-dehydrorhamnose 3,5-epimerase-like enzyme
MGITRNSECKIIQLQKIHNRAGNITVAGGSESIPFDIKRVYYLYDIPGGAHRGGHAHKQLEQIIIAVSGAFDVLIDDGKQQQILQMNSPDKGLHIIPGIWRELLNFSSGAICLVLASELYDFNDYIYDYPEFLKTKHLTK